jgi:drug/metabolite transporter (DMT)-like permease
MTMRRTVPAVHPRQAITLVIAAVACFAALDSTTKVLSTAVPLVMAMWFRYLFQALSTTLVLLPGRGRVLLRTHHPYLQVTRGAMLLGCSIFAFLSLQHMPVGEFTAIVMLTPLLITLLAAHALGERVSPLRWALVLGGFAGALIIIRPGGDMLGWAALYPVGVVLTNAAFQILTSRLARTDDPGTMHFYTGWVGALSMSCLLPWAWQAAGPATWAMLGLTALLSSLGHVLLIQGYRRAPAATLTPFLYFQIAFATLAGWLYFDHAPDLATWLGMLIIAGCGAAGTFLSAHEERRKA